MAEIHSRKRGREGRDDIHPRNVAFDVASPERSGGRGHLGGAAGVTTFKQRGEMIKKTASDILNRFTSSSPTTPLSVDEQSHMKTRLEGFVPVLEEFLSLQGKLKEWGFADEMDGLGTELWNLSTKVSRDDNFDKKVACLLRVVAYLLIESGRRESTGKDTEGAFRILKIANKAARACLDSNALSLATKILERGAAFQRDLSIAPKCGSLEAEHARCSSEFFVLRTRLAMRQGNAGVGEYMYSKSTTPELLPHLLTHTLESIASTTFTIGTDLLRNASNPTDKNEGIKWLRRSYDLLMREEERLSEEGQELKGGVMHNLAKAYLRRGDGGDGERARMVIGHIAEAFPTSQWTFLLKLELVQKESGDAKAYHAVLVSMIDLTPLTLQSFPSIISKVHNLVSRSPILAISALDTLLKRLLLTDNVEWIEQTLITRLWVTAKDPKECDEECVRSVLGVLDSVERGCEKAISGKAMHAGQILLWKVSEVLFAKGDYGGTIKWCEAARHPVFNGAGESNEAKIARRIILSHLELRQYGPAREIFSGLSPVIQSEAMSQFLLFRLALGSEDESLALQTLTNLYTAPRFTPQMLYTCALDSQEMGQQKVALKALRLVLEQVKSGAGDIGAVRTSALLRCVIRLTEGELDKLATVGMDDVEQLCEHFETAAVYAKQARQKPDGQKSQQFGLKELDWFSKNAFNFAVKACTSWPSESVVRLAEVCMKFLGLYPADMDTEARKEMLGRQFLCLYICVCALTFVGRKEDNINIEKSHFATARTHAKALRQLRESMQKEGLLEQGAPAAGGEFAVKYAIVLMFEFEAIAKESSWEELIGIIEEAEAVECPLRMYECMVDIILTENAPSSVTLVTMQALLGATIRNADPDIAKLSHWIRCLISIALTKNHETAEQMIPQVLQMIRENEDKYPRDEVHWLAGKLWNHAIDLWCAGDAGGCNKWCEYALSVCRFVRDGGLLEQQLQQNYTQILGKIAGR
ncbi:sporulation-specific protein 22 [Saitoella coloradoensis]